jgi:hypothetical protein
MNANTLLAFLAALFAASTAAAQQLPRKPPSAFGSLRAGLPETPPVTQPPVPPLVLSAAVEDVPAFNSESAKMFTARVQPILANACAGCHARKDHASRLKLRHTSSEFVDTEAATANLHAAARTVSRDRPAESLFLTKATTAHGGAKEPPLRSRAIPAFRYLELWTHWAAAAEGAPMPDVLPTAPAPVVVSPPTAPPPSIAQLTGGTAIGSKEPSPLPEPAAPSAGGVTHLTLGPKEPGKLPPLPKAEAIAPGGFATGPREPSVIQPTPAKPNPNDEFDPTAFNRAAHPARK